MKCNLEVLTVLSARIIQSILRLVFLFPNKIALSLMYLFADIIYLILKISPLRKEVERNIRLIMEPETKRLGSKVEGNRDVRSQVSEFYYSKKLLKNLTYMLVEILSLPFMKKEHLDSIIFVEGTKILDQALAKGKGVILVSLHTSNSESVQMGLTNLGYKTNMVTKDPPQSKIFKFLVKCRSAKGTHLINVETENMYKEALKVLKNNEILGLAIDTGAVEAGHVFIEFLGHKVPIYSGWTSLAERSEAVVLPVITKRLAGKNLATIKEPISVPKTEEEFQNLAPLFEDYIKADPSNWAFFINTREVHRMLGMHKIKRILFVSNGHGEDLVGAKLAEELQKQNSALEFSALPVVGEGKPYEELGIRILGPHKKMPSGGFIYMNILTTLKDVFSGVIGNTFKQISILRKQKRKTDLVVAIGDSVAIRGALLTKMPFIFIGTAESAYYDKSYPAWERRLLKKALAVFPRDKKTYESLAGSGLKVEFAGNTLMDCVKMEPLRFIGAGSVIGLLPGTRSDAYLNIKDFEKIAEEIEKEEKVKFIIATKEEKVPVKFEKKTFAEALSQSNIIIGLSGTGNEQAAGFGIPVVAFVGRGTQFTKRFAREQIKLLGNALSVVDSNPKIVAKEVWSILKDPMRYKNMLEEGKERMGETGAIKKIADRVLKLLLE